MFSTKILIQIIFKNDLLFIFDDLNQTKKTLENFNNSYLKFNFFKISYYRLYNFMFFST